MSAVLEDLKHALRLYRRTPIASLMVVVVLAIGMGFVAAFLSLYSDLILRPEPGFERGGRIVSVGVSDGRRSAGGLPAELIDRISKEVTTLEYVAGSMPQSFRIGTEREQAIGELVTRDFFPGLRPKMSLGSGFTAEQHDPEGDPVVVISWQYWQDSFDGRPDVLGKTIDIEGQAQRMIMSGMPGMPQPEAPAEEPPKDFRIVGVMGRDFTGTLPAQEKSQHTRFWMPVERGLPLSLPPQLAQNPALRMQLSVMRGIGRLQRGASTKAAIRELEGRFAQEEFLRMRPGAKYEVMDRIVQNVFIQRDTRRQLQLFLGASVLLALVAAANISLFLLARAPGRRRELGIRMAVGAPMKRLVRQLASEAAVLVLAAAVLGITLSVWLAKYLRGLSFLQRAQWRDVTLLDWRVLTLVGVFLLLLTLLVSLAPILGLKRLGIAASSRQVAARATVAQRIAGTAQITAAGVLAGAAIAFTWHLMAMLLGYPGFRTDLYAVSYSSNGGGVRIENGRVLGMVDAARLREAVAAIPGVTQVALGASAPGMRGYAASMSLPDPHEPGNPRAQVSFNILTIDSNYIELLGRRLLPGGRNLTQGETGSALVNQAFAQRFFGRDDVVGEPLPNLPLNRAGAPATQIVGVLEDVSYGHPLADPELAIFTSDGIAFGGNIIFESRLPAASLQMPFQDLARTLNISLNSSVVSLATARRDVLAPDRARGYLTILTATLVVLLAAFGFYGTQRYLVMAGRREYAIRASLGAGPQALGRLVLRRGLLLGAPGLLLGAPLAFILVAWLRGDYVTREVSPVLVTVGVTAGLVVLLLLACLGPARLARRTQPAPLLRED